MPPPVTFQLGLSDLRAFAIARASALRRTFNGSTMVRGAITVRADETVFYAEQVGSTGVYPWTCFTKIEAARCHVFLYRSPLQALIVPYAAVEDSEFGRMLAALAIA